MSNTPSRAQRLLPVWIFALAATSFGPWLSATAPAQQESLLRELPENEGKALLAPYELWVATFAPDEGSYGSGPRVLVISNDMGPRYAIVSIRGVRTELAHKETKGDTECKKGATREERFESPGAVVLTRFKTSPGNESCWVEGTVTVVAGTETETVRVKGVAGL